MAYKKSELFNKAKEMIQQHRLIFIEEIISFLPCGKTAFYSHFPPESNETNALKELLEKNKVEIKSSMRAKWYRSENATLQVALMKLLGTEEESHRLNGSSHKVDHTTKGAGIHVEPRPIVINVEGIPKSISQSM